VSDEDRPSEQDRPDGRGSSGAAAPPDAPDAGQVEDVPDTRHRLNTDAADPADPTDDADADSEDSADNAGEGLHAPELVIVTGMSGAGRSTAAKIFEDLGWYVVDNLAPTLIAPMVDLVMRESGGTDRLAFVVDVRGRAFFDTLRSTLDELDSAGLNHRIMFLESDDDVLVRRYEGVRRPHPHTTA